MCCRIFRKAMVTFGCKSVLPCTLHCNTTFFCIGTQLFLYIDIHVKCFVQFFIYFILTELLIDILYHLLIMKVLTAFILFLIFIYVYISGLLPIFFTGTDIFLQYLNFVFKPAVFFHFILKSICICMLLVMPTSLYMHCYSQKTKGRSSTEWLLPLRHILRAVFMCNFR